MCALYQSGGFLQILRKCRKLWAQSSRHMIPAAMALPMQVAVVTRDGVVQNFRSRWRRCFIIIGAGTKIRHQLQLDFIAGNTVLFFSEPSDESLNQWSGCNTLLYATHVAYHWRCYPSLWFVLGETWLHYLSINRPKHSGRVVPLQIVTDVKAGTCGDVGKQFCPAPWLPSILQSKPSAVQEY